VYQALAYRPAPQRRPAPPNVPPVPAPSGGGVVGALGLSDGRDGPHGRHRALPRTGGRVRWAPE
jgi:hypothetical protein